MISLRGEQKSAAMDDNSRYNTRGRKIVTKPHSEKVFAKDWQKVILKKNFKENPYPDKKEMDRISGEVGLDAKWLKNWYHTARKRLSLNKSDAVEDDNDGSSTLDDDKGHDDQAEMLRKLQRDFDELSAKYAMMTEILQEKLIIKHKADDLEKPDEILDKTLDKSSDTLTENVHRESLHQDWPHPEAPVAPVAIKEERPAQIAAHPQQQTPQQFAPYSYYPQFYPPGFMPYPQFYPQQPQHQQPSPQTQLPQQPPQQQFALPPHGAQMPAPPPASAQIFAPGQYQPSPQYPPHMVPQLPQYPQIPQQSQMPSA